MIILKEIENLKKVISGITKRQQKLNDWYKSKLDEIGRDSTLSELTCLLLKPHVIPGENNNI